ncbi:MAG: DUF2267 domain-containing protein, partial [Pseudomonadota bacterium]
MDELIERIVAAVGINQGTAQMAVSVMLNFLNKEGPDEAVSQLLAAIPGADQLLSQAAREDGGEGGGAGGLMGALGGLVGGQGGGLMAAASQLMGSGLDIGQIQGVAQEVVGFSREKAGDDIV